MLFDILEISPHRKNIQSILFDPFTLGCYQKDIQNETELQMAIDAIKTISQRDALTNITMAHLHYQGVLGFELNKDKSESIAEYHKDIPQAQFLLGQINQYRKNDITQSMIWYGRCQEKYFPCTVNILSLNHKPGQNTEETISKLSQIAKIYDYHLAYRYLGDFYKYKQGISEKTKLEFINYYYVQAAKYGNTYAMKQLFIPQQNVAEYVQLYGECQ